MASTLERLMAAGGFGAGLGGVTESAWRDFVEYVVETLDVGPGTRVFQVGCGAGALLYPLAENGYIVGGLDRSPVLIGWAGEAMPEGRFTAGDAAGLDPVEPWDVVVACGIFQQFADLDYARGVLARMAAKATHAIAILEVPDLDGRGATPGFDYLYYDRSWMLRALAEIGASAVQIEDLTIEGEGHTDAPSCFNVFARL